MAVSSLEPQFLRTLLELLELPANLIQTSMNDLKSQKLLKAQLKDKFQQRNWAEWEKLFEGKDVCVELVHELDEAIKHPVFQERKMLVDVPRKDGTQQKQIASPFKFSTLETEYKHTGVHLGEHTVEVLKELNYSQDQIDDLKASGVTGEEQNE